MDRQTDHRRAARLRIRRRRAAGTILMTLLTGAAFAAQPGVAVAARADGGVPARPGVAVAARADGASGAALFGDTFEDGDAGGWTSSGGRWVVEADGSQVYRQTGTSANAYARAGDPAWTDYAVGAVVRPAALSGERSFVGILARVQSGHSYYYLALRADQRVELGKVVRGRITALATASIPAPVIGQHRLSLVAKGTTLVGRVDDVTVTATDSQFSRGRIGLIARYASGSYDDVTVEAYLPTNPDTQAPLTPGRPTVVAVSPTTATITWPPSVDNVGVVQYGIYQGGQFYEQNFVRWLTGTGPLELTLSPTAADSHFAVLARDAAGNVSPLSPRTWVRQPPSHPKTGNDTVPPTAPGTPVVTGSTPDGRALLTWAPAVDNIAVLEYHVIQAVNIDEVRLVAKVSGPSAAVPWAGPAARVSVRAYDASWNSSATAFVPMGLPPTPGPTPPAD